MVWDFFQQNFECPIHFCPSRGKINNLPKVDSRSCCERSMFNKEPFVFQQDGAPAHTSDISQSWLRKNIPDFISKEEWPPSSPDLNPMDFSIWSILETKACAKSHSSVEALKKSLLREWVKIPQDTLRAAVEAFPELLKKVVGVKGGYID